MDRQTKAALKKDKFITTTTHGLEWASENRRSVLVTSILLLALILVVVISAVVYNDRSADASVAFGAAMQVYQTPLAQPGEDVPPGVKTFPNAVDRAKTANALFLDVAHQYSFTPDGKNALYFAGLTDIEANDAKDAEATLKKVADDWWDTNLAALARFSLAQLYRDTGRDAQAVDIYKQLTAKPTTTIPAGLAQLSLASLYEAQGKTEDAKKIYASLKDKDAKGPAGMIAAEKLNPTPQPPQAQ